MPPQMDEIHSSPSTTGRTKDDYDYDFRGAIGGGSPCGSNRGRKLKARSSDLVLNVLEIEPEECGGNDNEASMTNKITDTTTATNDDGATFFTPRNWYLFLLFFSATAYALMGCFVKLATTHQLDLSSTEIVMFRAIFQFAIVLGAMCWFSPGDDGDAVGSTTEYNQVPTTEDDGDRDREPANGDHDDGESIMAVKNGGTSQERHHLQHLPRRSERRPLICYNPFGPPNLYKIVVLRGMIGGLGFCLYYYTISALPLGDAITVLSLNPVVTVTLASIVLKEEVTRSKVVAASCSILGCIMMARPSFLFGRSYVLSPSDTGLVNGADDADESTIDQQGVSTVGYLTGLMGACCGATVQVLIRKAGKQGVSTLNMLFSWCVFGLFISTSIVLLSPRAFIWPSSTSVWGYIFGACVSGTAAHFLMNYAARKIPAGVSSLIRSSGIIWSYFLEVVVFSQLPNLLTVIGVILILMSLVVVAMDKNRSSG